MTVGIPARMRQSMRITTPCLGVRCSPERVTAAARRRRGADTDFHLISDISRNMQAAGNGSPGRDPAPDPYCRLPACEA